MISDNAAISVNAADLAPGMLGGGVLALWNSCPPSFLIEESTISGNLAGNSGTSGPVEAKGGGVYTTRVASVVNSTISGNLVGDLAATNEIASEGGGLAVVGFNGISVVPSSTVAGNQALGAPGTGARRW